MAELEADLARAVEALRSKRSPPAGSQARVLARLEARLGGGDPGDGGPAQGGGLGPGGGGAGAAAGNGAFAAKVMAVTLAMTAGGLLIVKLGVLTVRSFASDPVPLVESAISEPEAMATASIEVEPKPGGDGPISGQPPSVEAEPPSRADREPPRAASKPRPLAAAAPSPAEPDITAELALVEAARRARSPQEAIAELEQHARRFPSGTLLDEREALWAIASCELGDLDDAARRARALAVRRSKSPLIDRVAAACPALELEKK
ncbi:MAG: hypothetical protein R6X02_27225 [Enhygromyxa sp.]